MKFSFLKYLSIVLSWLILLEKSFSTTIFNSDENNLIYATNGDSESEKKFSFLSSNRFNASHDYYDHDFKFTKPYYYVSIPEDSRNTYATVLVSNKNVIIPGPDPGGGKNSSTFSDKFNNSKQDDLLESKNNYVSPYEKMGMYIPDPELRVRYKIAHSDEKKIFSIESRLVGDFYFLLIKTRTSDLNREKRSEYHLTIRAIIESVKKKNFKLKAKCDVYIQVEDTNDLSPIFFPTHYEVNVTEDTPIDSRLVNVSAFDPDIGLKSEIYYFLNSSDPDISLQFSVHPTLGIISNTRPFKRPSKFNSKNGWPQNYQYKLIILAKDRASHLHRSSSQVSSISKAVVLINVMPVNRHAPKMILKQHLTLITHPFNSFDSFLLEPFSQIFAILKITDDDGDDNLFGKICSLSIVEGNDLDLFQISNSSYKHEYQIELKSFNSTLNLSKKKLNSYLSKHFKSNQFIFKLILKAIDCGGLFSTQMINVIINPYSAKNSLSFTPFSSLFFMLKPTFEKDHYYSELHEVFLPGTLVTQVKIKSPQNWSDSFFHYSQNVPFVKFSLIHGDLKTFGITSNGLIFTKSKLDFETQKDYILEVSAEFKPNLSKFFSNFESSTTKIHIKIIDDNDHDPVFTNKGIKYFKSNSIIEITFNENKANGSLVYQINASDADQNENGLITFSIINDAFFSDHNRNPPFIIDSHSGQIRTTERLDFETGPKFYTLIVRASDSGLPFRRRSEILINITIIDINDHKPQFEQKDCTAFIPSNTKPWTEIVTLSAIDLDKKSEITYHIIDNLENKINSCFDLNKFTGVLQIICDINEMINKNEENYLKEMYINVSASDGQHFANVMPIKIVITNPSLRSNFQKIPSSEILVECKSSSDEIIKNSFDANDFEKKAYSKAFENNVIDEKNNEKSDYNIYVPTFEKSFPKEIYIRENVKIGTHIVTLFAKDEDFGYNSMLVWSLNLHFLPHFYLNKPFPFTIEAFEGKIKTIDFINREVQSKFELNITVCDLGYKPSQYCSSKLLKIFINDENDNYPTFDRSVYYFSILENSKPATIIANIHANDEDSDVNAVLKYSLLNHQQTFDIDSKTGLLTTKSEIDREKFDNYEIYIQATDSGFPALSATTRVILMVQDVNDNAPIFKEKIYFISIREDYPIGSLITKISAFDLDEGKGKKIRYLLKSTLENGEAFKIDEITGNIRLAKELDFEKRRLYNLTIIAKDEGVPILSSEANLIVEVADVDENEYPPKFSDIVEVGKIKENSPIGSYVMTIKAIDPDPPLNIDPERSVSYQIVAGDGLGRFSIDEQGKIFTKVVLDYETNWRYWLTIVAKDKDLVPKISHLHVLIEIENENDNAPITLEPFYVSNIYENSSIGSSVLQLQAYDLDLSSSRNEQLENQFEFQILNAEEDCPFAINSTSGLITIKKELDREIFAQYVLDIEIKEVNKSLINNLQVLSSKAPVIINILDVNDNEPKFIRSIFRCQAYNNLDKSIPICSVLAYDLDNIGDDNYSSNDNNYYSLHFQLLNDNENYFFINEVDGSIYFSQNYTIPKGEYSLMVLVSDNNEPPKSSQVQVMVKVFSTESNLNKTYSDNLKFLNDASDNILVVSEDEKVGYMLMIIKTNVLTESPVCSHLIESSEKGTFAIVDGALMLAKKLDFESIPLYNLAILITDGYQFKYLNISINVIDVNDNVPHFYQETYTINVYENITQDTSILTLRVNDIDTNDNHAYKIYTSNSLKSLAKFELEPWSGILRIKESLDYELIKQHILVIEASDSRLINLERNGWNNFQNSIKSPFKVSSHRSFTKLIVNVLDVNDHAPEFVSTYFEITLPETSAIGTYLLQTTATDSDTEDNGLISYSFISGNEENTFGIDSELGYIYLAKPLQINRQSEYYLVVKASDHGIIPLSSSVSVHVIVSLPENSHPLFENKIIYFDVLENIKIGTIIGSVKAISRQNLFYEIISSDSNNFAINMNNGELYLSQQLDYEKSKKFEVTVSAVNLVQSHDVVKVVINVLDVNDNRPQWNSTYYNGFISESAEIGTLLLQTQSTPLLLKAYDADSNSNGLVKYSINELSAQEYFKIDSSTGAITLIKQLDYEEFHEINFTVSVSDLGEPFSLKAEVDAFVMITVSNVNDCPPVFEQKVYQATLFLPTYSDVRIILLNTTDCDIDHHHHHHHHHHRTKTRLLNFSPVVYSLISTEKTINRFKVNETSGLVTVDDPSNIFEGIYDIIVSAFDGKFSDQTKISIHCKNLTRSSLRFTQLKYFTKVTENLNIPKNLIRLAIKGDKKNDHYFFRILNFDLSMFRILPSSGLIRTTGVPFDREKKNRYVLIVEVKSLFNPNKIDHCQVVVLIEDVNDNVPIFVNLPYYFAVNAKSSNLYEPIGKVQAIDQDVGQNGFVNYSILSGNNQNLFRIDSEKGYFYLTQSLENVYQTAYNIVVEASDNGVVPLKSVTEVSIKIVSEEMPFFEKQYYSITIPENQAPLLPFITINAFSPHGRQLIYSITSGNELEEFALDYNTDPSKSNTACSVYVVEKLDRETISEYRHVITAVDSVSGISASVLLQINVEDVNDNAPRFNQSIYTANILESASIGMHVLQVFAYDQDAAGTKNSEFRYNFYSNSSMFYIDSETGIIYLKQKLDFELTSNYQLTVVASDLGLPMLTSFIQVYINVIDVNDNSPFFVQPSYTATIDENVSQNHFIMQVTALDPDLIDKEKKKLRYKIISGNSDDSFRIDEKSGIITTLNAPRRLKNKSVHPFKFSLNVSVSDDIYINYTLVYIKIAFTNNHNPTFTRSFYNAIVSESVPIGTQIVHVKALDEDKGLFGKVTYHIVSQYALNWFKIHPQTGVISTIDKIDREKHHFFAMAIMAKDGGNRVSVSNVRITVTNLNDNAPEFLVNEYKSVICSDLPIGFNIIPVIAFDQDVSNLKSEIVYSIHELNVNNTVSQNSSQLFGIHRETGNIFVSLDLTSHAGEIYQFFVKAMDFGNLENVVPVTIQIMGPCKMKNDLVENIEVSVSELLKSGSVIVNINASDSQNLDFSLVQTSDQKRDNLVFSKFRIEPHGKIYLVSSLDYEESPRHILVVKVTHKSKFTVRYLNVIINVINENDNTPQFDSDSYFLELSEDQNSSFIMQIQAFDLDLDFTTREIKYLITSEKNNENNQSSKYFEINPFTGWLKLTQPLDREINQWHNLSIQINDGQNFNQTVLTIKVIDSNDNPPKFDHLNYVAAIYEDSPVGNVVIKLEAKDPDLVSKFQLRYYIVQGDLYNQFGITNTGEVFVNRELDREKLDRYELKILVTDTKFISETKLSISILDINDNGPICLKSEYFELISEDVAVGSRILIVEAEDKDEKENALFYFTLSEIENDNKNNSLPFMIDHQTGLLTTKSLLDRERKSSYYFQARVHDDRNRNLFCTSLIKILLSDVNDNPPSFVKTEYNVNVPEDSKPGIIVGKVHAIDPDLGINRQIFYSFIDSVDDTFIINNKTGIIRLNKPLDREEIDNYNLIVAAFDFGTPSISSKINFKVKVQDVNDNAPEFTRTQYEVSLFENSTVGSEVIVVFATSKDIGINADITYTITTGNKNDTFVIHPTSGIISLSKPLDYELVKQYFLSVKAEDGGIPSLSSETKVNISIIDINDNAPVFFQKLYSAVIKENTLIGEKIIALSAVDADSGYNAELNYYFKNQTLQTLELKDFAIQTKTGIILVKSQLDRETISSYILEVICVDGGNPPLTSSVLVTIEISDVNDNAPVFDQKNYSIYVQENKKLDDSILKFIISDTDSNLNAGPFFLEIVSGNEPADTFRINQQETDLRIGSNFALSKTNYFVLQIKATDSGNPALSSECWVYITVIEESHYPPVIESPKFVSVVTYFDQFQGGILAQIEVTDRDPYDKPKFDIANSIDKDSFGIDPEDGTLMAASGLNAGTYQVNVSVSDGKFTSFENIEVKIISISEETLINSLFISFAQVLPNTFLKDYQRSFFKALRNLLNVRMKDILIISIQSSKEGLKRNIENKNVTDILFAVEKPAFKSTLSFNGYYPIQVLRKKIIEKQSNLESLVGLKILEIGRNRCEEPEDRSTPLLCSHGICRDDIILDENQMTSHLFEKCSFVLPLHERKVYCSCHPGFGGDTCSQVVNECARTSPCPSFKECSLASSPLGYICKCPFGKTGITCNQNNVKYCHNEKDVSLCYQEINPISFTGTGYARYTLTRNIRERLSLRLKSFQTKSIIMFSAGPRDYTILEIVGGYIQYRFDCGLGEGLIRVETIQINDGKWHEVLIERKGNSASLTLDEKYITAGNAPGSQEFVTLHESDVYFGAEVKSHSSTFGSEDVSNGFVGCLDNIRLDNELLPLNQKVSSPVAVLKFLANVGFGGCKGNSFKHAKTCNCLNGGSCKLSLNGSYTCLCPANYQGSKCEIDLTNNHCSPNPCKNGGVCVILYSRNSYECSCPAEFGGINCEKSKLCSESVKCQNFGKCENSFCVCKSGFNGFHCEEDIDECASLTPVCPSHASCVNLNGSFLCLCPKDGTNLICASYHDPVHFFNLLNLRLEDLLFPAICVLIFLLSTCLIFTCCYCHKKGETKKRRTRAPPSVYRDELEGNEFLLKSSNKVDQKSNLNLKRFSKMSGMELLRMGQNGSFSSDLYPNHHFHQALRASTRSSSFSDTLNNFDALGYENSVDDISSSKGSRLKSYRNKKIKNSKSKEKLPVKTSSEFVNSIKSSQFPLNTESKIQNIYNEEQSNASNNAEGYHWDCYDLEEELKPISDDIHDIRQVSVNEVRDLESNSDNSQIELISSQDLNALASTKSPKTRFGTYTKAKADIVGCKDKVEKINLFESYNQVNDIEYVDESLPTSPIKYSTHPNNYLPTFQINGNDFSNSGNNDTIKMNIEEKQNSEKNVGNTQDLEITVIKSDNSKQSTFV